MSSKGQQFNDAVKGGKNSKGKGKGKKGEYDIFYII